MRSPLHLGFKLALGWRDRVRQGDLPAPGADLYASLSEAGFAFFEFGTGTCRRERERALLAREAAACAERGLRTSLHPYTKGEENPAAFGASGECPAALLAMLEAASAAAGTAGAPARLVIHPAEGTHDPASGSRADCRRRLAGRSLGYFDVMRQLCAADFPHVLPAVEYQMPTADGSPAVRIGDVPDELMEVSAGLGLCLDIGHHLLAVDLYGVDPIPPDGLLRRVEAVHLHDVVDGRDHQVISAGSDRARACMEALVDAGFTGDVTLEYSMAAIGEAGSFERVMEQSVGALAAWLA